METPEELMAAFLESVTYTGDVRPWREVPETDTSEDEPDGDRLRTTQQHPESAIHQAADAHVEKVAVAIRYAFAMGRKAIDKARLREATNVQEATTATAGVALAVREALAKVLPGTLSKVLAAGGAVGLAHVKTLKIAEAFRALKPPTTPKLEMAFDESDPHAIEWAQEHGAELAKNLSDTTKQAIRDAIVGAYEGDSLDDAYEAILEAVGDEDRAQLIARTEVMTAANEGQREGWSQAVESGLLPPDMQRTWIATVGACDDCDELDESVADMDGQYPDPGEDGPPLHPNCLPGDSFVAAGGHISAQSERRYEGDLIIIHTATGKQLRCTPNHPVLTNAGWIAASQIHKGDQVISCVQSKLVLSTDLHDIHMPTRIQEVARAYRVSGAMQFCSVVTSTPDFHGDGVDGQVAVIRTNGFLREALQTQRQKYGRNFLFQFRLACQHLIRYGSFEQLLKWLFCAPYRVMHRLDEFVNFVLRHAFETTLVPSANGRTALVSGSSQSLSLLRCSVLVPFNSKPVSHLSNAISDSTSPQGNTAINQDLFDGFTRTMVPSRDSLERLIGFVQFDDVTSIRVRYFMGHVYNLETEHGWYVADGIVTGNCRCTEGIVG